MVLAPDWLALTLGLWWEHKAGHTHMPTARKLLLLLAALILSTLASPSMPSHPTTDQSLYCSHRPVRCRISPLIVLRMNAETGIRTAETAIGLRNWDQHSGPPYMSCWVHPVGRKYLASTV